MEILPEQGCYAFYGGFLAPCGECRVSLKKINQISRKVATIRHDCKHAEGFYCVNIAKFLINASLLLMCANNCVICRMITSNVDLCGIYILIISLF